MIDFITNFLDYFFYILIAFVAVYWLFFTSFKEKKDNIRDTIKQHTDMFSKTKKYMEKAESRKKNRSKNSEKADETNENTNMKQ